MGENEQPKGWVKLFHSHCWITGLGKPWPLCS